MVIDLSIFVSHSLPFKDLEDIARIQEEFWDFKCGNSTWAYWESRWIQLTKFQCEVWRLSILEDNVALEVGNPEMIEPWLDIVDESDVVPEDGKNRLFMQSFS